MKDKELREFLGEEQSTFSRGIHALHSLDKIGERIDNLEQRLLGKRSDFRFLTPLPSVDERFDLLEQNVNMLIDYLGIKKKVTPFKVEFVKKEQEGK